MQRKRGHFLTKKIIKKQPLFLRKKMEKNRRNFFNSQNYKEKTKNRLARSRFFVLPMVFMDILHFDFHQNVT